ncbi:hypothetical protein V6N12_046866 [Hibiscus sabdariffa]|uniref:Leucine-rich repeat-containing N-terminal plant-type domain-containing protein n=1 Tax=Hibiscus sabdariffa TaxID=183260 RepID=A0ABR2ABS7_9ROSI
MMESKWVWFIIIGVMLSVLEDSLTDACLKHERVALLHLKPFFNHFNYLYKWDEEKGWDCCRWEGVECNTTTTTTTTGRLIRLSLNSTRGYNMGDWYLNASLFHPFKGLNSLNLSYNSIAGFLENQGIEKLSRLDNLETLDLSYNSWRNNTLFHMGALSSLKTLNFRGNLVEGNLLHIQEAFSSVKTLSLQGQLSDPDNELVKVGNGNFLPYLSPKVQLKAISGTFPVWSLENNTKLQELVLKGNSFRGHLSFSSAPNFDLSLMDMSDNKLQGQIPSNNMFNFSTFEMLFLSKNAFEGNIPPCLNGMKDLSFLDLSNNHLSGRVPQELIMNSSFSILRLSNNNLCGNVVPAILKANKLRNLYLDGNNFSGEMPNVDVSTFRFPTSLQEIDLSNNKLYGKLPRWIGNISYLERLALSNNNFEGCIPMEFCNLNTLEFLQLSQNNLSGSIPSCFNPPNIEHVHLHGNRLSGPLSFALYNSSSLVTLDLGGNNLTGTIPKWIGTLSSLSVLFLRANHLQGRIPI